MSKQPTAHYTLPDLPEPLFAGIAKLSRDEHRWNFLLPVSRSCRDVVLTNASHIELRLVGFQDSLDTDKHAYQPQARLLDRACRQAAHGLSLGLQLGSSEAYRSALPQLLQPGLSNGGYPAVHELKVTTGQCKGLELLSQAFPALRRLQLGAALTLDGAVFSGLQGCQQLCQLRLHHCIISIEALDASTAALGRLPSLKEVSVGVLDSSAAALALIAQLTGLTKLALEAPDILDSDWVEAATRNPHLQSLSLAPESWETLGRMVPAVALERLLRRCPSITQLDLSHTTINQVGLDVLLAHGTNITSLHASCIEATASRANAPCSWEELRLREKPKLLHIAYLPLSTVKHLTIGTLSQSGADLQLPAGTVPDDQLPALLRQAATNLASAPAWQLGNHSRIELCKAFVGPEFAQHSLSSELRLMLLQALAPLRSSPHLVEVQLTSFDCGQAEVAALQHSLGSGLTSLSLLFCRLTPCFWSALHQMLPQLMVLTLTNVDCEVSDLVVFCCTRPLTRKFKVQLGFGMNECRSIQTSLRQQGITHVSVTRAG